LFHPCGSFVLAEVSPESLKNWKRSLADFSYEYVYLTGKSSTSSDQPLVESVKVVLEEVPQVGEIAIAPPVGGLFTTTDTVA
jgi:hypothetical protein